MRRFALVLVLVTLAGCCTPAIVQEKTLAAAEGNLASLQKMRAELPPILNDDAVIEGTDHTPRSLWAQRLKAYIVRAKAIIAGLKNDKSFSVKAAAEEGN